MGKNLGTVPGNPVNKGTWENPSPRHCTAMAVIGILFKRMTSWLGLTEINFLDLEIINHISSPIQYLAEYNI